MGFERVFQALLRFTQIDDFLELIYNKNIQSVIDRFHMLEQQDAIKTIIETFKVGEFLVTDQDDVEKVIFVSNLIPGPKICSSAEYGWILVADRDITLGMQASITYGGEIAENDEEEGTRLISSRWVIFDKTIVDGSDHTLEEKGCWIRGAKEFEYNAVFSGWNEKNSLEIEPIQPIKKYEEIIIYYPQTRSRKKVKH